ncbi:hypothetical protein DXG03_000795 [Asterophora parasitica]|uniref:JmjC domain-containing protein n=1 Tax=Asterophora parasitica TaxID=117018 RepID=A0A9P7GH70_9AGAR|nr:hypothetical protein DXG03_000795 [Asterophora parasitica]
MGIEERRKKLMAARPNWGDQPDPHHVQDIYTCSTTTSTDASAVDDQTIPAMNNVVFPPQYDSVARITTKDWSLNRILASGKNFQRVPRVSSTATTKKINESERNGLPLIIEGLHKHPEWKWTYFKPEWLEDHGPKEISVRNVHTWTDTTIPLPEFIAKSRASPKFATAEGVETLMCYLGIGDTFTPCHKDLCASSGQNLMCYTENDGSSFWFMTKSSDAPEASKYFQKLNQELDHENHIVSVEQLAQAPFTVYVSEQKLGDLVLVPPRSCHQVVNYGGITIKTSWSRMTLKGLETAYYHELPIYQRHGDTTCPTRVCRPETYRVKSTIYHTLRQRTEDLAKLQRKDLHSRRLPTDNKHEKLVEVTKTLLKLFDEILVEEYAPSYRKMHCLSSASSLSPSSSSGNSDIIDLHCDFCGADIFQSFFECRKPLDHSHGAFRAAPINSQFMRVGWYDTFVQTGRTEDSDEETSQDSPMPDVTLSAPQSPSIPPPIDSPTTISHTPSGSSTPPAVQPSSSQIDSHSPTSASSAITTDATPTPLKRKRMLFDYVEIPMLAYLPQEASKLTSSQVARATSVVNHPQEQSASDGTSTSISSTIDAEVVNPQRELDAMQVDKNADPKSTIDPPQRQAPTVISNAPSTTCHTKPPIPRLNLSARMPMPSKRKRRLALTNPARSAKAASSKSDPRPANVITAANNRTAAGVALHNPPSGAVKNTPGVGSAPGPLYPPNDTIRNLRFQKRPRLLSPATASYQSSSSSSAYPASSASEKVASALNRAVTDNNAMVNAVDVPSSSTEHPAPNVGQRPVPELEAEIKSLKETVVNLSEQMKLCQPQPLPVIQAPSSQPMSDLLTCLMTAQMLSRNSGFPVNIANPSGPWPSQWWQMHEQTFPMQTATWSDTRDYASSYPPPTLGPWEQARERNYEGPYTDDPLRVTQTRGHYTTNAIVPTGTTNSMSTSRAPTITKGQGLIRGLLQGHSDARTLVSTMTGLIQGSRASTSTKGQGGLL